VTDVILTLLRDAKVRVITWPPHTTQIFQQLDISLFGVLKQRGHSQFPFDDDQSTSDFVFRTYRPFKQTIVEATIWGAFHEAGCEIDVGHEPYRIQFDEKKAAENSGISGNVVAGLSTGQSVDAKTKREVWMDKSSRVKMNRYC
jgi:hypothetical protein